jgi:hypothetical protein
LLAFVPLWVVSLGHSKADGESAALLMLLAGALGTLPSAENKQAPPDDVGDPRPWFLPQASPAAERVSAPVAA